MAIWNKGKSLAEQNASREAQWICDWCSHINDSRRSRCEKCNGVRKTA